MSVGGERVIRAKICSVSQDAFLLNDTLRRALNPHDRADLSDAKLWRALETVGWANVARTRGGLDLHDLEALSPGERQLLCVARALLSECQIYVLDEANAAFLSGVRSGILAALREKTVLCVTHDLGVAQDAFFHRRVVMCDGCLQPGAAAFREMRMHDATSRLNK